MDSSKIKNLETLAEITFKLEFELNRVKDWINTQLSGSGTTDAELNRCSCNCKNTFQNSNNLSQVDPNLTTRNIYHENESSQVFQGSSQMPLYREPRPGGLVAVSKSLCQNPGTSTSTTTIIASQNAETNESHDDMEVKIETENFEPETDMILPHLNDNDNANTSCISSNPFFETPEPEIDPLQLVSVFTENEYNNEEPLVTQTRISGKKKKTRFYPDIMKRIKSEQIHESVKNWSKQGKIPSNSSKSHICTICTISFKRPYDLKNHLEEHSTSTMMKYICRFCSKGFKSANSMHSHVSRNHRGERNDFELKCECGLGFNVKSALENHQIEAHIGLKCKFCNKVFDKRQKLSNHLQKIHLSCATSGCEENFLTKDALKLHRRKNHPTYRMDH